jgi:hypothetical protein
MRSGDLTVSKRGHVWEGVVLGCGLRCVISLSPVGGATMMGGCEGTGMWAQVISLHTMCPVGGTTGKGACEGSLASHTPHSGKGVWCRRLVPLPPEFGRS